MNSKTRWLPFPTGSSPKVWIGENDNPENGLKLYNPYSRKGQVAKQWFALVHTYSKPFFRSRYQANPLLDNLSDVLSEMLGHKDFAFSYSMGTPGPHRKITAQISRNQIPFAYAKIGFTPQANALIKCELETLRMLGELKLPSVLIPRPLGFSASSEQTVLCQSAPTTAATARPAHATSLDARFLADLIIATRSSASVSDVIQNIMQSEADQLGGSAHPYTSVTLTNALKYINVAFSDAAVQTAFSHGDYAPWNTYSISPGSLYVFDWEYGAYHRPILNDIFHYVFMPARLVDRYTTDIMARALLNIDQHPVFGSVIRELDINTTDIPAYAMLYLLTQGVRQHSPENTFDAYIIDCMHKILVAKEYPDEKRRILAVAYACEPDEGSEPGVGWHMVEAIAENNDAWIITRKNNEPVISAYLERRPNPGLHFCYVDLPKWAGFWKKGGRGIRTYYYLWQLLAAKKARQLNRDFDFDLAQHITFVNDWMYTFLALLPVPFIWGPIGSHPEIPATLAPDRRTLIMDRLRTGFQAAMRFMDPLFWLSAKRAALIIGIERNVGAHGPIKWLAANRFIAHTAIGVEDIPENHVKSRQYKDSFEVLSVGRLIPIKGFHLTIQAFAKLTEHQPNAKLTIIGKGPLKNQLQSLTKILGVSDRIKFQDWLPREEILKQMKEADAFLFPSFEGGGMVVLEAMANELPVVCLNYGGTAEMVTPDCGFLVDASSIEASTSDLAEALRQLAASPATREARGKAARKRVSQYYLWEKRHEVLGHWYSKLVRSQYNKPVT